MTPSGALPRRWELPSPDNNGVFDPSIVRDPESGRYWVSYSSVARQEGGDDHVSTMLAYSVDGLTWCSSGVAVNPATTETSPPADAAPGAHVHWTHEVSELVHDPGAPAGERWKLVWMRYLTEDRKQRFEYGWLALRAAPTPEALASAPERKWIAAAGYFFTDSIEAYNDRVGGPPEHKLSMVGGSLAECIVLSEPSLLATSNTLYLAFLCGAAGHPETSRVELVALSHPAETWSYRGVLLEADDGDSINPVIDGFSAPEMFVSGGTTYLMATPHVSDLMATPPVTDIYRGCIGYELDLETATLLDSAADGYPDPKFATLGPTFFNGACSYEPSLPEVGILRSEFYVDSTPHFRLFATGDGPP